jgi:hypothetical protein
MQAAASHTGEMHPVKNVENGAERTEFDLALQFYKKEGNTVASLPYDTKITLASLLKQAAHGRWDTHPRLLVLSETSITPQHCAHPSHCITPRSRGVSHTARTHRAFPTDATRIRKRLSVGSIGWVPIDGQSPSSPPPTSTVPSTRSVV